jgi:glycogen synthase
LTRHRRSVRLPQAVQKAAHATHQTLVRRVMQEDWSWEESARHYLRLYERALAAPPTPVTMP